MITLLKMLPDKWEKAKGYLRLDLDRIEAVLNQRWAVTFGDDNLLLSSTVSGDYSTDSRYISNQGPSHAMKWDQINLANGVTNVLGVTHGGTGTGTAFTPGSVVFAGAAGVYAQDNASLFFDDTNNLLGIGTATPAYKLDIAGNGHVGTGPFDFTTMNDPGGINAVDVAVILTANVNSLPPKGAVLIESEVIEYSSRAGNTLSGLTRGAYLSTAAAHADGSVVRPIFLSVARPAQSGFHFLDGCMFGGTGGVTDTISGFSTLRLGSPTSAISLLAGNWVGILGAGISAVYGNGFAGTVSGHNFTLRTSNATQLTIDTSGNVGIGITPVAKFDVKVDTDLVFRVRKTASLVEVFSANDANNAYTDLTLQNATLRLVGANQLIGIALAAAPQARAHFKAETTDAGGIRFGDDCWIYRSAVGVVKITDSLLVFNRTTSNTFVIDPVGTGYIWFNGRALIRSPADSQITLFNTAETTFDRINFGGTSATDPALRREGALLAAKQADAADYTYFKAYEFFLTSGGYLMRSNANMTDGAAAAVGTLNNAPAAGNPTKWLKFDDNGTIRWIPAW